MKQKTFMQQYRAYKRQIYRNSLIPTLDPAVIANFGYKLTHQFMRYEQLINKMQPCTIHTRINYRDYAVNLKPHYWQQNAKALTKMWRNWRHM